MQRAGVQRLPERKATAEEGFRQRAAHMRHMNPATSKGVVALRIDGRHRDGGPHRIHASRPTDRSVVAAIPNNSTNSDAWLATRMWDQGAGNFKGCGEHAAERMQLSSRSCVSQSSTLTHALTSKRKF
jgi:hypothetical protein